MSPLELDLVDQVGFGNVYGTLADVVIPWRRAEKRKLETLEAAKLQVGHDLSKLEIDEKRLQLQQTYLQIEEKKIQLEKMRLELNQQKIDLVIKIINEIAPNLSEEARGNYIIQLLNSMNLLAESPMTLVTAPDEQDLTDF